jgi:hypothetical protein
MHVLPGPCVAESSFGQVDAENHLLLCAAAAAAFTRLFQTSTVVSAYAWRGAVPEHSIAQALSVDAAVEAAG